MAVNIVVYVYRGTTTRAKNNKKETFELYNLGN